jgi:hypothetical protein
MINHLLLLETRAGTAEVLWAALNRWDARHQPHIVSVSDLAVGQPRQDCHILFQLLAARIYEFLEQRSPRLGTSRVVAVVDAAEWFYLNPLKAVGDYQPAKASPLISLLILAFPEILWSFAYLGENNDGAVRGRPSKFVRRAHLLDTWVAEGEMPPLEPLMDPTGLRNHVRKNAVNSMLSGSNRHEPLPLRKEWAVSMDDEVSYAYFNAYTEYRHGFRAMPISSLRAAQWLLGKDRPATERAPMVSFEDVFMRFPDQQGGEQGLKLSDFDIRDEELPLLSRTKHRIVLTSGQKGKHDRSIREELRRRNCRRMLKPTGGMFRIWIDSGLHQALRSQNSDGSRWIGAFAPGYRPVSTVGPEVEGLAHSAPGALHSVADDLLFRVDNLKDAATTVEEVLLCAVLATDAFELLASRTPTLSLSALALKHELEAKAECRFIGVQNHFDVCSRLRKVQKAVRILSKWSDPWERDVIRWNSEAAVVGRLLEVFRCYARFDEEQLYAVRNRTLHRRLWFRRGFTRIFGPRLGKIGGTWLRWVNPIYWLAWYVGFLLKSILTFVVVIAVWIGALTWSFHEVESTIPAQIVTADTSGNVTNHTDRDEFVAEINPWVRALADSFSCMVSVGTPLHAKVIESSGSMVGWAYLLSCFGMGIGFLHLGILVSHLYAIVARKG